MHLLQKQGRHHQILAVTAFCLIAAIVWWLKRPMSAEDVARVSIRALETGDSKTLINLALPEERTKLNLNEGTVTQFLKSTIWRNGFPTGLKVTRISASQMYYPQFEVSSKVDGAISNIHLPFVIAITFDPDGKWHLPLGEFLCYCTWASDGTGNTDNSELKRIASIYGKYFRECGIKGIRDHAIGYRYWN